MKPFLGNFYGLWRFFFWSHCFYIFKTYFLYFPYPKFCTFVCRSIRLLPLFLLSIAPVSVPTIPIQRETKQNEAEKDGRIILTRQQFFNRSTNCGKRMTCDEKNLVLNSDTKSPLFKSGNWQWSLAIFQKGTNYDEKDLIVWSQRSWQSSYFGHQRCMVQIQSSASFQYK